jgi:glutamate/tyrosine decarboxylase-like PLP-dependent enzyme
MREELQKQWDHRKISALPLDGMTEENLRKRIFEWSEKEKALWNTGKVSGAFYSNPAHMEAATTFGAHYLYQNPLHLETYKELLRMENEVLDMTNALITTSNKTYYGTIASSET